MVDDAESSHFCADRLKRSGTDAMFVREVFQAWKKLAFRPLEVYKNGQKGPLVVLVVGK